MAGRILIIDDEPQITRVLRASFAAQAYEVRIANDPEEFTALVAYIQTLGRAKDWRPDKDYEK